MWLYIKVYLIQMSQRFVNNRRLTFSIVRIYFRTLGISAAYNFSIPRGYVWRRDHCTGPGTAFRWNPVVLRILSWRERREVAKREEFKEKTTKQPLRQRLRQVSWWNQTQNRSCDQRASQRRHSTRNLDSGALLRFGRVVVQSSYSWDWEEKEK
jgi:hypothetical protein